MTTHQFDFRDATLPYLPPGVRDLLTAPDYLLYNPVVCNQERRLGFLIKLNITNSIDTCQNIGQDEITRFAVRSNYSFIVDFDLALVLQEMLASFSEGTCSTRNTHSTCSTHRIPNTLTTDIKSAILRQIDMDFYRMHVYYNHVRCHTLQSYKQMISSWFGKRHAVMYRVYYLLLMFTTQTSFYYMYKMLHELYCGVTNLHLITSNDYPGVDVIDDKQIDDKQIDGKQLQIVLSKKFLVMNSETCQIVRTIHAFMLAKPISSNSIKMYWLTTPV